MQQNIRSNGKTSLTLSRKQLLTIYKTFLRSHVDYADIIYDKPFNDAFKEKPEKVQCSYYYWTNKRHFLGTLAQRTGS